LDNNGSTRRTRLVWLLLLAGFIVLLVWVGLKSWRIYQAGNSLLARQSQAESLLAAGPRNMDPNAAEDLIFGLRSDVLSLRNEVAFILPVLPYLDGLPRIGPLLAATPQLVEMADAGTESAAYAFRGMKPALSLLSAEDETNNRIPQVLQILEDARSDIARASIAMDRVVAARNAIRNVDDLPWRVRTLLDQADDWLPLAQGGLKLSLVAPDMLGLNEPRRYLVIAQNEDEIRATGGFISGAGLIELERGQISKLDFQDANSVDAWSANQVLTKPYGDAPRALSEMMLLDLFLFRDANFWPDYPISAEKAMALYSYGENVPSIDGAIAIDQEFVKLLVSGTGPVLVPDTGEVINENNALISLQEAWTLEEGVGNRKAFLGVFAQAIRNRLENEMSQVDPINLARQLGKALPAKNLQIHMRDPLSSAVLAELGWDGHLSAPRDHDALLTVDSNMGYNKANIFIEQATAYHIRLAEDGSGEAELSITHIHNGEDNGEPCQQGTLEEYRQGGEYRDLTDKCYYNYLRVYVPENSRLISGPQHIVPAETWYGGYEWDRPTELLSELPGFTTFANFMLLPRASELTSQFTYALPPTITQDEGRHKKYQLRLHKQAGTPAQPVEIAVTIPHGARFLSAQPQPAAVENDTIYFNLDLNSDQTISVTYD
jgi:hypothetical protein